ncbi:MAG: amidase family protein [Pseudomonadales bacterium]
MSIDIYSSAADMLTALRNKEISSIELTELHINRIEAIDDKINAIPVRTFDMAREAAIAADKMIAAGDSGALIGLPLTLKESTLTKGLPQSAGIPDFAQHKPEQNGLIAQRIFDAGAGLLGKTNIPVALGDWQADSPVYGRTNNPWDLERTPGGSTGGGGAALAAGMTPLEIGSDIGGSIRVPAAYCGCFGHRPSETAIPKSGAFPMADLPNPAFLLGVQGPLARTAKDLSLMFDVIAGPDHFEDTAWRLDLPAPRGNSIKDFRVGVLTSVMDIPCSNQTVQKLEELTQVLQNHGATTCAAEPGIDFQAYFADYMRLLNLMITQMEPREQREARAAAARNSSDPFAEATADGLTQDAHAFMQVVTRRQIAQYQWREYFKSVDVIIAPITLDSAFPHQTGAMEERTLLVDNVERSYMENILYPSLAIFTGLPATAIPAGLDDKGLPIGLQIIGPYLEDRTTLKFAELVEEAWVKFQAPPAWS